MTSLKLWSTGELQITAQPVDLAVNAVVDFGDGTPGIPASPATRFLKHTYKKPGAYTVTITAAGVPVASARIFVRGNAAPVIMWAPGADNPNFIDVHWNDGPADLVSTYDVVWGDDSPPVTVTAPSGFQASHGYAAGDYVLKIFDQQARQWGRYPVKVCDKVYDPDLTVKQGASTYEVVATVAALADPGQAVKVWWGDGTEPDTITSPQVGTQVTHTYDFDGDYMVQIGYADGTGEGGAQFVQIPWPAARGPKPVSMMVWSPEPDKALGVRAKWWGSGWDYTLHWGDGSKQRVRWQDPPVPHVYATAGAYTVTGVSDLQADWTVSAVVVVRATVSPQFTVSHVGGGLVSATFTEVGAPVDMRIDWDDGSPLDRLPDGAWQTQHQYKLGSRRPVITVKDVPAKRVKHVLGPVIPPNPVPVEKGLLAWHDKAGSRTNGTLKGSGFEPGEKLTAMFSYSSDTGFREVTCNSQGRFQVDYRYEFTPGSYPWRAIHVKRADQQPGSGKVAVGLPVLLRKDYASQTLSLGFDWVFEDPYLIRAVVHAPKQGEYTVDWGDGVTDKVCCDGWVLDAQHRYQGSGPFSVTVTDPAGVTETRTIGSTSHREPGWGVSGIDGTSPNGMLWIGINGTSGQQFPAVKNRWGMLRSWQYDDYLMVADSPRTSWSNSYDYRGHPGEQATLQISSPLSDLYERTVTLPHPKTKNFDHVEPGVQLMPGPDNSVTLSGWWRIVTPWDGGRSGEIRVRNTSGGILSDGWAAEFQLPEGAHVSEVWPDPDSQVFDLGNNRWSVTSSKVIEVEKQGVVSMRIEHPGIEEANPTGVVALAVRTR